MSLNPLNDLSKEYLDKVADYNTTKAQEASQKWEDLGGPTPGNYKSTDDSAKLKQEALVEPKIKGYEKKANALARKAAFRPFNKESFSNWRNDLFEGPGFKGGEKEAEKRISEKKGINNTIVINPKLKEAVKEIGGELLEVTELEPNLEEAVEYFYEQGINEEGLDLIIEEVGLDDFVDFVSDSEFLTEAKKRVPGGGPYPAKKMNVRTLKATQKKAEEIKADKSDVVKKATPKDTLSRARTERAFKKPKLAKPAPKKEASTPVSKKDYDGDGKKETPKAEHRGVRNKKITQAVAKAKPAQPKKPVSKDGLRAKIKSAYEAGVKRHRKATQPVRVFHKGMKAGAKKTVKFAKDVKKAVVGESREDEDPPSWSSMNPEDRGNPEYEKTQSYRQQQAWQRLKRIRDKKKNKVSEATDAQLKAQEKAVFELEKKEANANRAKALKKRENEIEEKFATQYKDKGKLSKTDAPGSRHDHTHDVDPRMADYVPKGKVRKSSKAETRANVLKFDMKKEGFSNWREELLETVNCDCDCGHDPCIKCGESHHRVEEEVGISSAAAMEKARKEAELKAKEEAAVKKAKKVNEAKVDTGKSAAEKAEARNKRNTPPGKDKDTDLKTFITRKPGESLGSARARVRRQKHDKQQAAAKAAKAKERATGMLKKYDADGDGKVRVIDAGYKPQGQLVERGGVSEAVKGQDTETRKAMAAERRGGDRKKSAKEGEKYAVYKGAQIAYADKVTKAKKHIHGVSEDKAFDNVVGKLRKKYGKDAVLTKDSPKPKAQPQPKAKPQKPLTDKEKAHREVIARYGGEANYKAGRGLGT